MYTFGRMENVESLFDEVEVLEGAVACELSSQDVVASRIGAEIQVDTDITEKEIARRYPIVTSKHAEREKRVAAVREEGPGRLEELQRKLANARHELVVTHPPILLLPFEITAEIFNWHTLMSGKMKTMLLVCKRWTRVAYSSPRIWSRIAVTDCSPEEVLLQGAIICDTVDYLRAVLARAQASPLQVELCIRGYSTFGVSKVTPRSSLRYGPLAAANCDEAISLILDNKILEHCTYFALVCRDSRYDFAGWPIVVANMTIRPLLSSLDIFGSLKHSGLHIIQSLIKFSPSLRHIRWCYSDQGLEDIEVGVLTEKIESFGWLHPRSSCRLLHESSSLRELGLYDSPAVALTLPALQVLRWSLSTYSVLPLITAPHLHTLILTHQRVYTGPLSAGSITLPNLRVAIHSEVPNIISICGFQTPALEHLSIESPRQDPTALFELFDGSVHMPTPKSLHLQCAFTDAALIAVLGRLTWLEELQVAGTIAKDAFWEVLTPSSEPTWRAPLRKSHTDERANRILTPNLKVLLVDYSKGNLYTPPIPQSTKRMTRQRRTELAQASKLLADTSKGGEWTVIRASAVAVAREQAGCPLETLVCWSPKKNVEVLIGSLDTLPQRPK